MTTASHDTPRVKICPTMPAWGYEGMAYHRSELTTFCEAVNDLLILNKQNGCPAFYGFGLEHLAQSRQRGTRNSLRSQGRG